MAPTPRATAVTCRYAPVALPATVASPARRPRATARPMTNRTLGPGMTSTTRVTAANVSRRSNGSTRLPYQSPHGEAGHGGAGRGAPGDLQFHRAELRRQLVEVRVRDMVGVRQPALGH